MTTTPIPLDPTVKVSRDLTEIAACYADLEAQAIADGDNPLIPGGPAMFALGPIANLETWEHLVQSTERFNRPLTSAEDEDPDDAWSATQLVHYWAGEWRQARGEDYDDLTRSMATELNYIRTALSWAREHEPRWDAFAGDIRTARTRLENTVSAGRRSDRSRICCDRPTCTTKSPQLVRVYARRYLTGWTCTTCSTATDALYVCEDCRRPAPASAGRCTRIVGPKSDRHPCGGRLRHQPAPEFCFTPTCPSFAQPTEVHASNPDDDQWKCPICKHYFDDRELQKAHARMLWRPEADRMVRLPEAIATLKAQGRGERTIRRWLAPTREEADRCTVCAALWAYQEYGTCPAEIEEDGETEVCGGELAQVWVGNETVVEGWCELATRTTWLWWPDLWRLHLNTRTTPRSRAS